MSISPRKRSWSLTFLRKKVSTDAGDRKSMYDIKYEQMREKAVLQRLILIGRLHDDVTDRKEVGARLERLHLQLSQQHVWDQVSGLLLLYQRCLLHVVESSRDILMSVLKDVHLMQQQPNCTLEEVKILFLDHEPKSRMFQKWSYKVLGPVPVEEDLELEDQEEEQEEEGTETLVCGVLSTLHKFQTRLEISPEAPPGLVLDQNPDLIIPQETLERLLDRRELLSVDQHLQMYDSPLHIRMEFGQVKLQNFLPSM